MKQTGILLVSLSLFVFCLRAQDSTGVYPGADESSPSLSQYFSWINNTNEGSTEAQTLTNLEFFKWLHKEYGMILDIYVVSAGAIDKGSWYGSMESDEFKAQFPHGFDSIYQKAKEMGTRLGTWGGPDGFGNTPEEEQDRIDMFVRLCRDYEFRLLKFDAVVGQLRDNKQEAFIKMMTECRKYSPDLIFLNHRLNLSDEAKKHATTSLWEGEETYIDVHMPNHVITAPHHRAGAISRNVVPGLIRMTEDHGVCLSSCLNYWEDDLILQAFNRNLILSPQIYGNPWFLRDDEYPKLARIFRLAREYGSIMVDGMLLPEASYGSKAVSRGDADTRLITLRNLSWDQKNFQLHISEEIGLSKEQQYEVRVIHPTEKIIGAFRYGERCTIDLAPFRSALVLVTPAGKGGLGIKGSDYEIVRDVADQEKIINLLGFPGESRWITLDAGSSKFKEATINGRSNRKLVKGKQVKIDFPGEKLSEDYYRRIGELSECEVPEDAEALYEATVYSADNNALEIRSLERSGPSEIPAVIAAREAFVNQPLFEARGLWDQFMFDGDENTSFYVNRRTRRSPLINYGSLRIDFGQTIHLDELVIETEDEHGLQPWKFGEAVNMEVSADLKNWNPVTVLAGPVIKARLDENMPVRYIRFRGTPDKIIEVKGYLKGRELNRDSWRGSNLFSPYARFKAEAAWSISTVVNEIHPGTYLALALEGEHGIEGAYAAIRVDGLAVGAPDRSPSYPCNAWEYPVQRANSHYTYYIPLRKEMEGRKIDIVVLGMKGGEKNFKANAYLTCYPVPYQKIELKLK
ncbi:MAG: hypothetical protein DRJ13_03100 [Bacteroidetes bacterium]|nr:MAG: hypothetical protein DRJ13_03100 [Bacteroidota bacterium]